MENKDVILLNARGTGKVCMIAEFMEEIERINKLNSENGIDGSYDESYFMNMKENDLNYNDTPSQQERETEFIESLRKTALKKKRRR